MKLYAIYIFDNTYLYLNLKEIVVCHQKGIGQKILINMEKIPRRTLRNSTFFCQGWHESYQIQFCLPTRGLMDINLCLCIINNCKKEGLTKWDNNQ